MMRKKQGILVIADGLGDRPISLLGRLTPLEFADTPNLDKLSKEGMTGNVYPISPGVPVGTDVGHLEIFGCNSIEVYPGRGPIEAISAGFDLQKNDVAFRGNFATVGENDVVLDRRAGRITQDTHRLAASLDGMVLSDGTVAYVRTLTEHRVAVVLRGDNLSMDIECTDPGTAHEGEALVKPYALIECEKAVRTAALLQEFTEKCNEILKKHPVNIKRQAEGMYPANVIITRGAGMNSSIPNIAEKFDIKAATIAGDVTIGGIGKLVGFDYFTDANFTGGFDTHVASKGQKALELIRQGYDWVIVHIKATDLAGHDNLPFEKVEIIEKIDKMIGELMDSVDADSCYIAVTSDHSTPCEVRDHTGDSVPTIIWGEDVRSDSPIKAGEKYFAKGMLNNLTAHDIFMLQMDLMGFVKKIGA